MVRYERSGESHKVSRLNFELLVIDLSDTLSGEHIDPFFLPVVEVVDEGFLSRWNATDVDTGSD
jgi:hypothetical protein